MRHAWIGSKGRSHALFGVRAKMLCSNLANRRGPYDTSFARPHHSQLTYTANLNLINAWEQYHRHEYRLDLSLQLHTLTFYHWTPWSTCSDNCGWLRPAAQGLEPGRIILARVGGLRGHHVIRHMAPTVLLPLNPRSWLAGVPRRDSAPYNCFVAEHYLPASGSF